MSNEELLAKYKAIFPDNVEAIVVRKDDYDRLYGDLTTENIELKQEIERLNKCIKDDKENADEIIVEQQREIERLNNILKALEKGIKDNIAELEDLTFSYDRIYEDKEILRFLQELKGSDKE